VGDDRDRSRRRRCRGDHRRVRGADQLAQPAADRRRDHAPTAPHRLPRHRSGGAGWALAGFALGVLAGLLWRRVLPGLATAFAAWFGLAFLAAQVRIHYLTTTSLEQSGRDFEIDQRWTKSGVRVDDTQINTVLQAVGIQQSSGPVTAQPGTSSSIDPVQYLPQHGYTQITSYQPDSRYWTIQWIEFGALAALALLLLGAAFWLLRRRST
jgi:hypothetical protein